MLARHSKRFPAPGRLKITMKRPSSKAKGKIRLGLVIKSALLALLVLVGLTVQRGSISAHLHHGHEPQEGPLALPGEHAGRRPHDA